MKTLKTAIAVLFATFMLTACGGGSPESVAKKFQSAILDGDFEEAGEYATKSTAPLLKGIGAMLPMEQLNELKEETKGAKVKVLSSEEDGDKATVTLEVTTPKGEIEKIEYELIKEGGDWKVEFKK